MDGLPKETPGIRKGRLEPRAFRLGREVVLEVDSTVYELSAIYRSCYQFTDSLYLFLARDSEQPDTVLISLTPKNPEADLASCLGEFVNNLLDQQLRGVLAREMGPVRELIVAQAFHEGNLLDPQRDDGDYEDDPRCICRSQ